MTLCEQIRERWPLRSMATRLGIELPRDGVKFRHPVRADHNPSCTVRGEHLFDWSRDPKGLDAIGLFAMAKGLDVKAAITELARELTGAEARQRGRGTAPSVPSRPEYHRLEQSTKLASMDTPSRLSETVREPTHATPLLPWAPTERRPYRPLEATKPAAPPFAQLEIPSPRDLATLAQLRAIAPHALHTASELGHLFFAESKDGRCFVITDATRQLHQSRRLDGQPWAFIQAKAWTSVAAHGLAGWPLGAREIGAREHVLLCEGGPDWLVAHEAEPEMAACAMLGAKQTILADALPCFAGKCVRILAHDDEAGTAAAKRWAAQLVQAGARVSAVRLRFDDARDLNDCTRLSPERFHHHQLHRLLCP